MSEIPRIVSAEVVIPGVLKLRWDDGYVGLVDLRPVIARGKVFTFLEDPANFAAVQVGEYGHGLVWLTRDGNEIDFGSDSLRQRAIRQAELQLAAG